MSPFANRRVPRFRRRSYTQLFSTATGREIVPLLSIGSDRVCPLSRWRERARVRVEACSQLRPSPYPLPGVPGRGDKYLSPDALKVRRSPRPVGEGDLSANWANRGRRSISFTIRTSRMGSAAASVASLSPHHLVHHPREADGVCGLDHTVGPFYTSVSVRNTENSQGNVSEPVEQRTTQ